MELSIEEIRNNAINLIKEWRGTARGAQWFGNYLLVEKLQDRESALIRNLWNLYGIAL